MDLKKAAIAGTLESSDVHVTIEPNDGNGVELSIKSSVLRQYGKQIKKVVLETLDNLVVTDAKVSIVDKGALDCTIRARVEGAVFRSIEQYDSIPWKGWSDNESK
ncbi:citrate lyase acyl carrier protein [Clostridium swellfunianum]|uniref:citrate lyase acyl carrier protein n=1 Tax=Clostridium swellfunianum TaxID=1367462 RepID=UPI00202EB156|nr:citrate lyase acyl carrier protein [Clostridium swellfunianum]MCM0650933.1 citrate lyase acyl carrier protein [Clostridium swellfunianum]